MEDLKKSVSVKTQKEFCCYVEFVYCDLANIKGSGPFKGPVTSYGKIPD